MRTPPIQITRTDYNLLQVMLHDPFALGPEDKNCREALAQELMRARIMPGEKIPGDVVTLRSRARLLDMTTNEVLELTIVLPQEVDVEAGRISVFAPLGTAMLGYRKGDVFNWKMPGGESRFRVEEVIFQPEAADRAAQREMRLSGRLS